MQRWLVTRRDCHVLSSEMTVWSAGQTALAKALQRTTVLLQHEPAEQGMPALPLSRQSSELPVSSLPARSLIAT